MGLWGSEPQPGNPRTSATLAICQPGVAICVATYSVGIRDSGYSPIHEPDSCVRAMATCIDVPAALSPDRSFGEFNTHSTTGESES